MEPGWSKTKHNYVLVLSMLHLYLEVGYLDVIIEILSLF